VQKIEQKSERGVLKMILFDSFAKSLHNLSASLEHQPHPAFIFELNDIEVNLKCRISPHLQGYMCLKDKRTLKWIKDHPRHTSHFGIMHGPPQQASEISALSKRMWNSFIMKGVSQTTSLSPLATTRNANDWSNRIGGHAALSKSLLSKNLHHILHTAVSQKKYRAAHNNHLLLFGHCAVVGCRYRAN
jgi:hypothetical protein